MRLELTRAGLLVELANHYTTKRERVLEDDVFIENTRLVSGSETQDLNLRAPT